MSKVKEQGRPATGSLRARSGAGIAELVGLEYTTNAASVGPFRVAVIGSAALRRELRSAYLVREMLPGTVEDCLKTDSPDVVVIEETTLRYGVWAGHVARDAPLSRDLLDIIDWSTSGTHQVVVVTDGEDDDVSKAMRNIGVEFFPNQSFFTRPRASAMALPKFYSLVDAYARDNLHKGNTKP